MTDFTGLIDPSKTLVKSYKYIFVPDPPPPPPPPYTPPPSPYYNPSPVPSPSPSGGYSGYLYVPPGIAVSAGGYGYISGPNGGVAWIDITGAHYADL